MKKRIVSIVLLLSLCLGLMPAGTWAVDEGQTAMMYGEAPAVYLEEVVTPPVSLWGLRTAGWTDVNYSGQGVFEAYYAQLDETAQGLYTKLKNALQNPTASVVITLDSPVTFEGLTFTKSGGGYSLSDSSAIDSWIAENVYMAYYALLRDHPEMPWLAAHQYGASYGFSYTVPDTNPDTFNGSAVLESLTFSLTNIPTQIDTVSEAEAFASAVEDIDNQFIIRGDDISDYDTLKSIHDGLCKLITYEADNQSTYPYDQTAHSALMAPNKTVCAGYTAAFKLLCDRSGIPCVYVSGKAFNESDLANGAGGAHAWNYVLLYGAWYAVDVTWGDQTTDDQPWNIYYDFFLSGQDTLPSYSFEQISFSQSHQQSGA